MTTAMRLLQVLLAYVTVGVLAPRWARPQWDRSAWTSRALAATTYARRALLQQGLGYCLAVQLPGWIVPEELA